MKDNEYIVVLIITSSQKEAAKIGKILVEEKLAASANIIPSIRSFFFWKQEFHDIPEALLILNTKKFLFEKITKRAKELHSYEIPEIIALPILFGSNDFLGWVKGNVLT